MKKRINGLINFFYYRFLQLTSKTVRRQLKNPKEIPLIIISFNQLEHLKNLVSFLLDRNFTNIVIVDNCSTYGPLLDYFETIKDKVTLERQASNLGYRVFFNSPELIEKYTKGYYIITDPDILPNPKLPENFLKSFISELGNNFNKVTKVGFALNLQNIPDFYPNKDKVIHWEEKYWKDEIKPEIYNADIDTTLALYKPLYPKRFKNVNYYKALRFAGNYTCEHMGWFIDPNDYNNEQRHYFGVADNSASWKLNQQGELTGYKKDY